MRKHVYQLPLILLLLFIDDQSEPAWPSCHCNLYEHSNPYQDMQ